MNEDYEEYEEFEEGFTIEEMEEMAYANCLSKISQTQSVSEAKEWAQVQKSLTENRIARMATFSHGN